MTDPTPLPLTERFAHLIEGVFRLVCVCFAHDPVTLALIARILNRIRRAGDPIRAYEGADRARRAPAGRHARRIIVRSHALRATAGAHTYPRPLAAPDDPPQSRGRRSVQRPVANPARNRAEYPLPMFRTRGRQLTIRLPDGMSVPGVGSKKGPDSAPPSHARLVPSSKL
jgi:hypothetical protein